ncbi:MAG: hypothetical protein RDV48_21785 [Candidatus Eremiobacteraeota bacterium]|nr:hypothetical protein [Candidatus Eremiobacteraeota bacterium]
MMRGDWKLIMIVATLITLGLTALFYGNAGDQRGCLFFLPTIVVVWLLYIVVFKNRFGNLK